MSGPTIDELKMQLKELRAELDQAKTEAAKCAEEVKEAHDVKARLMAILLAIPDMVFDLDTEGSFLDFFAPNPQKLFSKPKDFIGKKIEEIIPGETGIMIAASFRRAMETGAETICRYSLQMPDGERFYEATNIPIRGEKNEIERGISVVHDITERRRAEDALKKSEQEKSTVLNATTELVIYLDTDMKIIWANRASAEALGLKPEELVGRVCHELWYQTPDTCDNCPTAKALKTGQPEKGEVSTPEGKTWYNRGYPVRDAEGNLTGVVELSLDITKRKHVEDALRRSEEKFKNLSDEISEGVVVISAKQKYIWLNKAFAQMFGYTVEELTGMESGTVIADEAFKEMKTRARDTIAEPLGETKHFESIGKKKNGEKIIIEVSAKRIIFDNQPALQSVMRDITERKRAEEALIESEERYRSLADAAQDFIFIVGPDGLVKYINSYGAKQVGLTPEDIVGKPHSDFFPAGIGDRQKRNLQEVFETGKSVYMEAMTSFPEGILWLGTRLVPIKNKDGENASILGISRNVTDRKQAEDQVLKTKKEAEFYLDLMSHDLTNFNQTLLGNLTLLERQGTLSDKQIKYLGSCKRQLTRAENLISQVRAFSQVKYIEKHHLKAIDLNTVLNDALKMVKTLYPVKNIEVEFNPLGIKNAKGTDLLDSVFTNVIENAVKHSSNDNVRVTVSITESPIEPNMFWEIQVNDNGPGIPDEIKEKIFDRFSKIGVEKGMGLGLSLARAITEKLGGSIWVEDRIPGDYSGGSVFKIAIPKA